MPSVDPAAIESLLDLTTEMLELVFFPLLAVELIWLWRTGRLRWSRVKEMAANVSSLLVIVPAGIAGTALWFVVFEAVRGLSVAAIPTTAVSALVCVLLADFIYYWEHRFEHTHRLPWDLYHSVHHSSPMFDQTTGLRLSGFDALLTLGFSSPLALIGFSPTLVMISVGLVIGYQTWIHTEVVRTLPRWAEAVFNTASHHRAHHGADPIYLDKNYGGILIVWDRLFGTFQPEIHTPNYGLTTQIESSNPLDVQFSELKRLLRDLRADRSWGARLRRLWNRPGWQQSGSSVGQASEVTSPVSTS